MAKAIKKSSTVGGRKKRVVGKASGLGAAEAKGSSTAAAVGKAGVKKKKHRGRQLRAAELELKKLWPNGVPDTVSTKSAQAQVNAAGNNFSYDTVSRALGRR